MPISAVSARRGPYTHWVVERLIATVVVVAVFVATAMSEPLLWGSRLAGPVSIQDKDLRQTLVAASVTFVLLGVALWATMTAALQYQTQFTAASFVLGCILIVIMSCTFFFLRRRLVQNLAELSFRRKQRQLCVADRSCTAARDEAAQTTSFENDDNW